MPAACPWPRACGADFILLLNNDAVVESSCLDLLVQAAADSPETGLLSPYIVSMTRPPRPWYVGGSFSLWSGIPVQARRRSDIARPRRTAGGGLRYGLCDAHQTGGGQERRLFDARLFAYCEDLDFRSGPGMPASAF